MNAKIRFTARSQHEDVEIKAKLKDTGKWAVFGYCHPASARLIKRDGLKRHLNLVRLPWPFSPRLPASAQRGGREWPSNRPETPLPDLPA